MNSLFGELKYNLQRKDNGLIKIILINIIVFVLTSIILVVSHISDNLDVLAFVNKQTQLPGRINDFLHRPWTLVTYFFSHADVFHILFNMLALYWFGKLIVEYIGNRRLVNLYILGGLAGGVIYLLLCNLVPFFVKNIAAFGLIGASGAVYAVVVGAATLLPEYTFYLIFLGPVRIKYIAAFFIFTSFIGTVGHNAGGNLCHLGGALMGYLFIKQLQRGKDMGKYLSKSGDLIENIFTRRPNLKVSYQNKEKSYKEEIPNQNEIDEILDKIGRTGYSSLSKEEKQKLFKASQNK